MKRNSIIHGIRFAPDMPPEILGKSQFSDLVYIPVTGLIPDFMLKKSMLSMSTKEIAEKNFVLEEDIDVEADKIE